MRHYAETMDDRTVSAEIRRQGAFYVDSKTNTFVCLACVNMAAIAITLRGVKKRNPWDVEWNLKKKGVGLRPCRNNQWAGRVAPGLSRHI